MKRKRLANRIRRVGITYNLTPEQYRALVDACYKNRQGEPLCMMGCGRKATQVDHDHKCCKGAYSCGKCVRGLLCGPCNTTLGRMRDRPELFRNMAQYLNHPPAHAVFMGLD